MTVLFRSVAEAELVQAWEHYASIQLELGDDFLVKVDEALARAAANPESYATVHRDLRRVRLKRFPHLLIYRMVSDVLVVVACTHPRQNTSRWRGRR